MSKEAITLSIRNVKHRPQRQLKILVLKLRNKARSCRDERASQVLHQQRYQAMLHYFITTKVALKRATCLMVFSCVSLFLLYYPL